ncbi:hypothetical protein ACFWBN_13905 [Streptomyces sp. NPDC059989]|uniref:hypothetical protein n=1 Tax=Streptomyces sp. NPDC059989 TaxID=3347026 RepID=UPI00367714C6
MAYRHWCGECSHKTAWLSESESEQQLIEHYAKQHPGVLPGGSFEVNKKDPNGLGCLPMLGILFVLLLLAAQCQR